MEPAGWETATLTIPQMENPITARYSMMRSTHWKLVVQRIPQMQMKVMRASQKAAATDRRVPDVLAAGAGDPAPLVARAAACTAPATMGAEMQKMMLVATWTQPLNQPTNGWTSLESQEYEAPQSGSRRFRWK